MDFGEIEFEEMVEDLARPNSEQEVSRLPFSPPPSPVPQRPLKRAAD